MSQARVWSGAVLAAAMVVGLTACGPEAGDPAQQDPATGGSTEDSAEESSEGATGTVTFDGAPVEPIDRLRCGAQGGESGVFGVVGDGDFLTLRPDRATYESGDITWVTSSVGGEGGLAVTETGAEGALELYEEGTANDLDERIFLEIVVDVTC